MKKLTIFVFLLQCIQSVYAQSPTLAWAKSMGGKSSEYSYAIAKDVSGNVYTSGKFYSISDFDPGESVFNLTTPIGGSDVFISKLNNIGEFQWAKQIGGVGNDCAYSLATDIAGNIYITGSFSGTVDFDPNSEIFNLTSKGSNDIFIVKLNVQGNLEWAKNMGGTGYDEGRAIYIQSDGTIYTTGFFEGNVDLDPNESQVNFTSKGNYDIYVSKLTSEGDFIWAKQIGGTELDYSFSIIANSNDVYISGSFQSSADFDPNSGTALLTSSGYHDIFITKLDVSGNFIWAKSMGGSGNDRANSIVIDKNNDNIYLTGHFSQTADFDPNTNVYELTSTGNHDVFIAKLNSSGEFQWVQQLGGNQSDDGSSIAIDKQNNVYIIGYLNFGNIFISKFDPTSTLLWTKFIGSNGINTGTSICVDNFDNIYTTGYYEKITSFSLTEESFNLMPSGGYDVFVQKIKQCDGPECEVTKISDPTADILTLFPNPSNTYVHINTSQVAEQIVIFNTLGKTVAEIQPVSKSTFIDIASYEKGIYFVKVLTKEKLQTAKITKQ